MMNITRADARGATKTGWLDSRHTFSFGHYHDPQAMGFGPLRVLNDDRVVPGAGFPPHGHANMEIVSYVLKGALEHKDSLGTGSVIRPGDVQRMSAGTGIRHSEFNASHDDPVHFLQIWIEPANENSAPGYEQKTFTDEEKRGRLKLVASADGREGSLTLNQDAAMYVGLVGDGEAAAHSLKAGRGAWVHVARGLVTVNGEPMRAGDGAGLVDVDAVRLDGTHEAEVLLFDLPHRRAA